MADVISARQSARAIAHGKKTLLVPVLPARDAVHFPALINTLHVVREPSLKALKKAMDGDRRVVVLSQRDMALEDPAGSDLYRVGTVSEVLQAVPMPDGGARVALRGLSRIKVARIVNRSGAFWAEIEDLHEYAAAGVEADALIRAAVEAFTRVVELNKAIPPESLQTVVHLEDAGRLADAIAHHLPVRSAAKQEVLELLDASERLQRVLALVKREEQVQSLNASIHQRVERELGDGQREYYLREQLRIIQEELQIREDRVGEYEEYRRRIEAAHMPEEALDRALTELKRLDRTPAASPEGMVLRNYLDCLVALPWNLLTQDRLNVKEAATILDREHFGLEKVKERILDHLAVLQLNPRLRAPILCFIGPPGVGKTSIGRSIAEAMGRKFVRISLGGVRDEAEIRGHRRTYVGSMPGRIMQSLKNCGARNPVFMLDEIDKIAGDFRGDPTSALLEALDPEQNGRFSDHYVESPFDLSDAMFIATANQLENIPSALLDRMELIRFPSYTDAERLRIGASFLWPKAVREHGLDGLNVGLADETLCSIATDYTREAGVRDLERKLATLARKTARLAAEGHKVPSPLAPNALPEMLGRPRYLRDKLHEQGQVGVATGLVVSDSGGDVIAIEASIMPPQSEKPELRLTGNMGQVMQESAEAALTFVRAHAAQLGGAPFQFDVHIHVPEGAIRKDGPSAGLTMAVALASAYSGRSVRPDVAMTGEITLRGRVLPVGGIRDKVLAAYRAGQKTVIIPAQNVADLEDVPAEIQASLTILPVESLEQALAAALAELPTTAVASVPTRGINP